VSDTVDGFVRAGQVDGIVGEVIQLGTGRTVSIGELFEAACRVIGVTATVVQDAARLRPDGSEVEVLLSDPAKAKALLGWEAEVTLEAGLARTVQWLQENMHRYNAERYHV
jgi:nucleoside-diphosphate-sugar epimerase